MLKLILLLLVVQVSFSATSQSYEALCKQKKITFTGKSAWEIDGKITDWTILLGAYTGNALNPFNPTRDVTNWGLDLDCPNPPAKPSDHDNAIGNNDIRFLANTQDDHNLYFYFRRTSNASGLKTFYYFIDTNADGFMKMGEPVLSGTFNGHQLIQYSYGFYVPHPYENYVADKGNYMYDPGSYLVDGYSMPGSVTELFTSKKIDKKFNLNSNETFEAAITENGYGVELSVPWKLFNANITGLPSLNSNSLLTYRVALQEGNNHYKSKNVKDNAGECCGKLGFIGSQLYTVENRSFNTLVANTSYKLSIELKNNTNIPQTIGLSQLHLDNIISNNAVNKNNITVTSIQDINCNGIADAGEPTVDFTTTTIYDIVDNNLIPVDVVYKPTSSYNTTPAYGKACFIVYITFPSGSGISAFTPILSTYVSELVLPICAPLDCGPLDNGRPINPVGFQEEETEPAATNTYLKENTKQETGAASKAAIYPNPARGSATLVLGGNVKDLEVTIADLAGRVIQTRQSITSSASKIENLRPGSYVVLVTNKRTGEKIVNKLIMLR